MVRVGKKSFWILSLLLVMPLLTGSSARGETHLAGTVGADLEIHNFTNSIFNPPLEYRADRNISNQFLDLRLNGPLINNHFANYMARARLQGTQVKSGTGDGNTFKYLNPKITNYFGSFSVFPDRPYPMRFYTGRSEINRVRYEAVNRSKVDLLDAGLAVVRRYRSVAEASGVDAQYLVNQGLELSLRAEHKKNELIRQYDFDENRNIWVDFATINPGVAPFFNIEIVNTIEDHDVLIFADFAFVDTVKAGGIYSMVLEEGMRDLEFVPVGLNSFSYRLDLQSDMIWKIFFNDPPGGMDSDLENDILALKLEYDNEGRFQTEADFGIDNGTYLRREPM